MAAERVDSRLGRISERSVALLASVVYALFVVWLASLHEPWRDEVVPMSLIAESGSFREVLERLHGFGHPALWYVLLFAGYKVFPHYVVLKMVNLVVAVVAAYLVLRRSTFTWLEKTLFLGGFFPLYFYPVINRNYGLSFLLAVLMCVLYRDRWKRFIPFCAVLLLLANTHAHSLVLVLAVVLSLLVELAFGLTDEGKAARRRPAVALGFVIALAGIALSTLTVMPGDDSIVLSGARPSVPDIAKAVGLALFAPGRYFPGLFLFDHWALSTAVIFSLYLLLYRKPVVLLLFGASTVGLSLFGDLFYSSINLRHQGALFIAITVAFWIERVVPVDERMARIGPLWSASRALSRRSGVLLVSILTLQIGMALRAVRDEIARPYSSSRALAELVDRDERLRDAILIGIPSANLESLPYYIDNPIYLIAEQKFERYRRFADVGREVVTLTEVLDGARALRSDYGKPVLILLGREISPEGPYEFKFTNGFRTFRYTRDALADFYDQTTFLAGFGGSISREDYSVFLVPAGGEGDRPKPRPK